MTDNLLAEDLPPQADPNKNYFEDLVGEGKRFQSPEALAKGKFESDNYIKVLEKRLDEIRNDYLKVREENTARANLQDLVTELRQSRPSSETPTANDQTIKPIDTNQIESLVSAKFQQYTTEQRQTENFNMVKGKLQQRYGSNYNQIVKDQLNDLGITENELNDMARKQPKMLLRTLGLDKEPSQTGDTAPPRSDQRSFGAPTAAKKKTWSYWKELKLKDPLAWHDKKTSIEMNKAAIELGEAFYDGDFYVQGLHEK